MTARRLHHLTAYPVAAFILLHLANHAALFWDPDAHIAVQSTLRLIYRNPIVEPVLLFAFTVQIALGLRLIWLRGWPKRAWPRIQIVSGAILAYFLVQHISAVLITRWLKPEVDTNIRWAAAVVSRFEFALYFAPYYTLGLAALFWHIAAFMARHPAKRARARVLAIIGTAFAALLIVTLSGGFFTIPLPAVNETYLDTFWSY